MRKAFERMVDFYKTPIGQDLMETTAGAAVAATGQALFTDMTPEEISRICKYYSNNISKLNEDLERSKVSKYSNNKSINKTGNRNVKQKKIN